MSNKSVQWCRLVVLFSVLLPLFHAQAITVAPDRIEEELASGETLTKKIRIFNENNETVLISPELGTLPPVNNGTVYIEEPRAQVLTTDLLSFNPDAFELAAGAWVDFPFKIQVPPVFKPGGYYGTLLFQFRGAESGSGVGIVGKVGPVVLLSVIGSVDAGAEFVGMGIEGGSRLALSHVPASVWFKLKNTGDVHIVPNGTLTITNWLGGVRDNVEVNIDDRVVLPGWERTFEETIAPLGENSLLREWRRLGFGWYRAELALTVGTRTVTEETHFWVIPWRSLGLAVLILAILLALRSSAKVHRHRFQ